MHMHVRGWGIERSVNNISTLCMLGWAVYRGMLIKINKSQHACGVGNIEECDTHWEEGGQYKGRFSIFN